MIYNFNIDKKKTIVEENNDHNNSYSHSNIVDYSIGCIT